MGAQVLLNLLKTQVVEKLAEHFIIFHKDFNKFINT